MAHPPPRGIIAVMQTRRWFRIHLSTAVVLMLAASLLLWANLRKSSSEMLMLLELEREFYIRPFYVGRGWPYLATGLKASTPISFRENAGSRTLDDIELPSSATEFYCPECLASDVAIALLILLLLAILCEWRIRRQNPSLPAGERADTNVVSAG